MNTSQGFIFVKYWYEILEFSTMLTGVDTKMIDEILDRFTAAIEEANVTINKQYKIQYSVSLAHLQPDTDISIEKMIQVTDATM
jgi:hypothetical protein